MAKVFKFSIIMAIYNMEQYLDEAINSIVNQTIGFEDNIQILFVNDGSTDQSEMICQSYQERFPQNITYLYKENGGVSEARNKGLEYAKGELVNFLDADDKLECDVLEKVYQFYMEKKDEIDLISIPLYFFEGKEGEHVLNYKFTSTRVIDIVKEPKCFQMHISSSFIKLETIKQYRFQTKLKFGEDAEVANKIILSKGSYGVVSDTKYWYRQRNTANSVIQGAKANKGNYITPLKYLHLELIHFAKEKYVEVPNYLQWMLVYDLGWKIRVAHVDEAVLNQEEIQEFLKLSKEILNHMSDEIILGNAYLKRCYYMYLLKIKYGDMLNEKLQLIGNKEEAVLCFNNMVIDILSLQTISVDNIELKDNTLQLFAGFYTTFDSFQAKIIVELNGVEKVILPQRYEKASIYSLNQVMMEGYAVSLNLPVTEKSNVIKIYLVINNSKVAMKIVQTKKEDKSEIIPDNYIIECKDRILTVIRKDEGKDNLSMITKAMPPSMHSEDVKKLIELYENRKNSQMPLVNKLTEKVKLYQLEKIVADMEDIDILSISDNQIPFSYRYFLLHNLKHKKENELNVATIYNQAFLYNQANVLIRRGSDLIVKIETMEYVDEKIIIAGKIVTPFPIAGFQLSCICNGKPHKCDLNKNNDKSEKWFGQSVIDTYEFKLEVPAEDKNDLYFELVIKNALITLKIKIDNALFDKFLTSANFTGSIIDRKRLVISKRNKQK